MFQSHVVQWKYVSHEIRQEREKLEITMSEIQIFKELLVVLRERADIKQTE